MFKIIVSYGLIFSRPSEALSASRGLPIVEQHQEQTAVRVIAATGRSVILKDLQIGSFDGGADVVFSGKVQQGWSVDAPAVIAPAETHTRLQAQLGGNHIGELTGLEELAVVSADTSVATARVESCIGIASNCKPVVAKGQAMTDSLIEPLVTEVSYDCHRAGAAGLTVAYRFQNPSVTPVELSITKECTARLRHGLYLGTSLDNSDDVIRDGATRWTTSTAVQRVIPASTKKLKFFLGLRVANGADSTSAQLMASPRVVVTTLSARRRLPEAGMALEIGRWQRQLVQRHKEAVAQHHQGYWGLPSQGSANAKAAEEVVRVQVIGSLANESAFLQVSQGNRRPGQPSPTRFDVKFECISRGAALVEIELTPLPTYQPYRPMVVSFVKKCGDVLRKGIDVSLSSAQPPVLGTRHSLSRRSASSVIDLVRDGINVKHMPDVDNLQSALTFQWRSHHEDLELPDATTLECGPPGIAEAYLAPPTVDKHDHGLISGQQAVHFVCMSPGRASCSLRIGWELYDGPTIQFRKECGGIRTDVRVESSLPSVKRASTFLQSSVLPPRGLSSLADADPDVAVGEHSTIVPPEEHNVTFNVFLDHKLRQGDEVLRFLKPRLNIAHPEVVRAHITGLLGTDQAEEIELEDFQQGGADLEVDMECLTAGTSDIEVTLPIGGGQAFKPLVFSFTKRCVSSRFIFPYAGVIAVFLFSLFFFFSFCTISACVKNFEAEMGHKFYADMALPKPPLTARGSDSARELKSAA